MPEVPVFTIHQRIESMNGAFRAYKGPSDFAAKARPLRNVPFESALRQAPPYTSPSMTKEAQYKGLVPLAHGFIEPLTHNTSFSIYTEDDGTHFTAAYGKIYHDILLPPLDPTQTTESTYKAQDNMLTLTTTVMEAGVVVPAIIKAGLLSNMGDAQSYMGHIMGGFKEGTFLLGTALAAIAEGSLPTTQEARNALTQGASQIQALTKLNLFPQKVLDTLVQFHVNPFTKSKNTAVPTFELKQDVIGFVENMGKYVFVPSVTDRLSYSDPSIAEMLNHLIPDTFTPLQDPQKKREFIGVLKDILHSYQAQPGRLETLECPARHAGVLNSWYTQQKNLLLDWYDAECKRLAK